MNRTLLIGDFHCRLLMKSRDTRYLDNSSLISTYEWLARLIHNLPIFPPLLDSRNFYQKNLNSQMWVAREKTKIPQPQRCPPLLPPVSNWSKLHPRDFRNGRRVRVTQTREECQMSCRRTRVIYSVGKEESAPRKNISLLRTN